MTSAWPAVAARSLLGLPFLRATVDDGRVGVIGQIRFTSHGRCGGSESMIAFTGAGGRRPGKALGGRSASCQRQLACPDRRCTGGVGQCQRESLAAVPLILQDNVDDGRIALHDGVWCHDRRNGHVVTLNIDSHQCSGGIIIGQLVDRQAVGGGERVAGEIHAGGIPRGVERRHPAGRQVHRRP